jgi:glycosyltransferase involved in cell wall biosynthesis
MKRICYVIPSMSPGGTERQLVNLVRGLVRDHEITVVCMSHDGALAGDARRAGAHVRVMGIRRGWNFTARSKLRRIFSTFAPDIVHTFLFGFDLFADLAARDVCVPVVVSSRRELAVWQQSWHLYLQKWANRYVDCIVANSRAAMDFAIEREKAPAELFRVIYNGIQADEYISTFEPDHVRLRFRIPFHRHVIGIVANFSPVKDHALFVAAADMLLKRRADVHFLLVGTGPLVGHVEGLIIKRGLDENFTRVSTLTEIADLYRLMSVCVLSSKVEGFPNALIEAMAAGTPVVAPAVGGIRELVHDHDTGRLVVSRSPVDFADAIEWILDNPDKTRSMAQRANQFVRTQLTMERMVGEYRRLYTELLTRSKGKDR